MRENKQLSLKLNFLTQHWLLLIIISKLSCCVYRHVPSIIVKKGKLPKHQLKHEFNFLWYKVCKIHLHTCIKIILCKKRKTILWFTIFRNICLLKFDHKNLHVIVDILHNIMIMMNSTHFGDFFFNDLIKFLI